MVIETGEQAATEGQEGKWDGNILNLELYQNIKPSKVKGFSWEKIKTNKHSVSLDR